MSDAYIVSAVRTPGCKKSRGAYKNTRPEDLVKTAVLGLMERTPGVEKKDVEEITCGCSFPEAEAGLNMGRVVAQMSGFPDSTTGCTVNRFCASGLEAVAIQAMRIRSGWNDVLIACGVESQSRVPLGGLLPRPHPEWAAECPDIYMAMGLTAENVANRYKVSREQQDEFGYHSVKKAAHAMQNKLFTEIVPTPCYSYVEKDGMMQKLTKLQDFDDGIRVETTLEGLAKLKPAFTPFGSVTAGNSSQNTDGAAAVMVVSEEALKRYNLTPLARVVAYATGGCKADEMGVGPIYAVPKVMEKAGLKIEDMGLIEINEAFASQSIYCLQQWGLYEDKSLWDSSNIDKCVVNPFGGAIALGHPLGATGCKLCAQLIARMQERKVKYGLETMCTGGGMGAACIFELC